MGVTSQNLLLPTEHIPKGSKVLDVGSGSGLISARMRDELGCTVTGLECGYENSNEGGSSIEASQLALGAENVIVSTLQEYTNSGECKKFPVVTVFKYNVNPDQKGDFCKALTRVVERDGVVIVHVVEREKAIKNSYCPRPFLVDELELNFDNVTVESRKYGDLKSGGEDILIVCRQPKAEIL